MKVPEMKLVMYGLKLLASAISFTNYQLHCTLLCDFCTDQLESWFHLSDLKAALEMFSEGHSTVNPLFNACLWSKFSVH